jgi:hypothetical protein
MVWISVNKKTAHTFRTAPKYNDIGAVREVDFRAVFLLLG